jgi:hypothetical protein
MRDDIDAKVNARRQERERLTQLSKARAKDLLKEKPAYLKIEEKFQRDFETPYLEEKKRQLEEVRSMRKPLDGRSLNEHQ